MRGPRFFLPLDFLLLNPSSLSYLDMWSPIPSFLFSLQASHHQTLPFDIPQPHHPRLFLFTAFVFYLSFVRKHWRSGDFFFDTPYLSTHLIPTSKLLSCLPPCPTLPHRHDTTPTIYPTNPCCQHCTARISHRTTKTRLSVSTIPFVIHLTELFVQVIFLCWMDGLYRIE